MFPLLVPCTLRGGRTRISGVMGFAGAVVVMHIPPIGPLALVCLSCAGLMIERQRRGAIAPRLGVGRVPVG